MDESTEYVVLDEGDFPAVEPDTHPAKDDAKVYRNNINFAYRAYIEWHYCLYACEDLREHVGQISKIREEKLSNNYLTFTSLPSCISLTDFPSCYIVRSAIQAELAYAITISGPNHVPLSSHRRSVSEICRSLQKEWWICSICLELMYRPHQAIPCQHTYCQSCLQSLAIRHPTQTACPLCRCAIGDCVFKADVDEQIQKMFPVEYAKLAETGSTNQPLPGKSARGRLTVMQWLRFTIGNRERGHADPTDRAMWHFCSFIIMITVFICSLYLGHYIILASRYMSDYIPEVQIPDEIRLANVPLVVIAFISLLILILR